jgi:hypothetical protein
VLTQYCWVIPNGRGSLLVGIPGVFLQACRRTVGAILLIRQLSFGDMLDTTRSGQGYHNSLAIAKACRSLVSRSS